MFLRLLSLDKCTSELSDFVIYHYFKAFVLYQMEDLTMSHRYLPLKNTYGSTTCKQFIVTNGFGMSPVDSLSQEACKMILQEKNSKKGKRARVEISALRRQADGQ